MNKYFHLYPDNAQQQRLRLGFSLKDLHQEAGFRDAMAPFGVEITEAEPDEFIESLSHQELLIRPPLPKELIVDFGSAIVAFAYSRDRQGTQEVGFIDHTGERETAYFPGPNPPKPKTKLRITN